MILLLFYAVKAFMTMLHVISNRVASALIVELNEDDLKELAPAVGDRIALRKFLERIKKVFTKHFVLCLHYFIVSESTSRVSTSSKCPSVP